MTAAPPQPVLAAVGFADQPARYIGDFGQYLIRAPIFRAVTDWLVSPADVHTIHCRPSMSSRAASR
jgi:hypothetical protein